MPHDIFLTRYPQSLLWHGNLPEGFDRFRVQVAHIVFEDLAPTLGLDDEFFRAAHDALAREVGVGVLAPGRSSEERCASFLVQPYDGWKGTHGTADDYYKSRLSLVELLFRAVEARPARQPPSARPSILARFLRREHGAPASTVAPDDDERAAIARAIAELNVRLRAARLPLHYHNGLLQFAQDELVEQRLAEPCWRILGGDPRWQNADRELKEAFDAADNRRPDAAFHAAKAL